MDTDTFETDSLCANCKENGTTRILLLKVPFFKDIALMSFECPHCNFKDNELQCCAKIPEKGVRYELLVDKVEDLNRTVVRSDYTSFSIPHLEFEVSSTKRGDVTTVEGIIAKAIYDLSLDEENLSKLEPETSENLKVFLPKLEELKLVKEPFRIILSDFSGNTFVSNPNAPKMDPNLVVHSFTRTEEQNRILGIYDKDEISAGTSDEIVSSNDTGKATIDSGNKSVDDVIKDVSKLDVESEVFQVSDNCPSCNAPCQVNIKLQKIPHFKEVIIMATNCEQCGYRSNEVKSGSGIEAKGIKITVTVNDKEDLCRDVLKSDTCTIFIPEIELDVGPTTLSGRFTTVEGLLVGIKDQLGQSMFTDSTDPRMKTQMDEFLQKLGDLMTGDTPFTLILNDPAGNSFVQSTSAPNPDEKMKIEYYERTFEENEDLGLNDMKTENYGKAQ